MHTIQIPLPIPSQNETEKGRNWRGRAAKTKARRTAWCSWTRGRMLQEGVAIASGPRSVHILAFRARRCDDIANLIGGAKACIDGMVDAGLMMDDKDAKASITYAQEVASKSPTGRPHTTVTITDIQ